MARSRSNGQGERRPVRQVLVLGLTLVILLGAAWAVLFSPLLVVREVEVRGTRVLTDEQVRDAAQVPLGRPLARVSERALADRVAALAPAAEVRVDLALPDRVTLEVTERVPRMVLERDGGFFLVDAEGFVFAETGAPPAGPDQLLTAQAPADPETLQSIGQVAAARPAGFVVERVTAHSPDSVVLHLPQERQVIMGSGEQAGVKFTVAESLLQSTDAKFIDVTAPDNPSTR